MHINVSSAKVRHPTGVSISTMVYYFKTTKLVLKFCRTLKYSNLVLPVKPPKVDYMR